MGGWRRVAPWTQEVGARRVGAPTQKKWARRVGARSLGGPKFRAFFPSPAAKFVLFFPLWVSSRGVLVVFLKSGGPKCARIGSLVVA